MISRAPDTSWRQHFPTYSFRERDIALEEYKAAAKNLESEERVFLNASNIAIVAAAALGSLAVGSLSRLTVAFEPVLAPAIVLLVLIGLALGFATITLRYFADRQKAIVFAARKVIVLRRMLGLSYGRLQLVLPNWRIEGADQPFAVRLFPGWNTYITYPLFMIAGIAGTVVFFITAKLEQDLAARQLSLRASPTLPVFAMAIITTVFLASLYRKALLDTHERMSLLRTRVIARWLRLRLVGNFEYVIYRATLASHELHRLGIDLTRVKRALIFIEDRTFHSHRGVSLRGSIRGILGVLGLKRRSGGSTVTQQLVRSLFIEDRGKIIRRKLVEILLALWFDRVVSKEDQLDMYLAAVRFERRVYGIPEAMRHFLGEVVREPSIAQALFLVERVSNIQSRLLAHKVAATLRAALAAELCSEADIGTVVQLYERAIAAGTIADNGSLPRLRALLASCPTNACSGRDDSRR